MLLSKGGCEGSDFCLLSQLVDPESSAQRRRVIDEAVTVARRLAKGKWNPESLTRVGDPLSSRLD